MIIKLLLILNNLVFFFNAKVCQMHKNNNFIHKVALPA